MEFDLQLVKSVDVEPEGPSEGPSDCTACTLSYEGLGPCRFLNQSPMEAKDDRVYLRFLPESCPLREHYLYRQEEC